MNSCSFVRRAAALLVLSTSVPVLAAPAGVLDPTFDGDGKQTIAFNLVGSGDKGANYDAAQAVVAAPGGRFYLVGSVNTGPLIEPLLAHSAVGITRLRFDGTVDSDFGDQGTRVHTLMPNGSSEVRHAVLQSDGKLLIAGKVNDGVDVYNRPMVCRFLPNGMKDAGFGDAVSPGCRFFLDVPGSFSAVLVQGDDRIVLGGGRSVDGVSYASLMRLHLDGSTDTTFGSAGVWMLDAAYGQSGISAVAQHADGDLFATGFANDFVNNDPGGNNTLVVRFDASSGAPDLSFGPNGARVIGVGAGADYSRRHDVGVDVHPFMDGSALVIGVTATDYSPNSASFSTRPFALKLLATGEPDPEFGGGIRVYNPCPVFLYDCDVDGKESGASFVFDDGRFVIAGTYRYAVDSANFFAMRLLPDGDLDLGFGSQMIGEEATALVDFALVAPELSIDDVAGAVADGERIVLAGYATTPPVADGIDPDRDFAAARLDHGLDTAFVVSPEAIGNGTVLPALPQNVGHSDHVEFDVTPAPGYQVDTIEGCGGALYDGVYTTDAIVSHCAVTVTFELKQNMMFSDSFEKQG